jgi:hypothetical protein
LRCNHFIHFNIFFLLHERARSLHPPCNHLRRVCEKIGEIFPKVIKFFTNNMFSPLSLSLSLHTHTHSYPVCGIEGASACHKFSKLSALVRLSNRKPRYNIVYPTESRDILQRTHIYDREHRYTTECRDILQRKPRYRELLRNSCLALFHDVRHRVAKRPGPPPAKVHVRGPELRVPVGIVHAHVLVHWHRRVDAAGHELARKVVARQHLGLGFRLGF